MDAKKERIFEPHSVLNPFIPQKLLFAKLVGAARTDRASQGSKPCVLAIILRP